LLSYQLKISAGDIVAVSTEKESKRTLLSVDEVLDQLRNPNADASLVRRAVGEIEKPEDWVEKAADNHYYALGEIQSEVEELLADPPKIIVEGRVFPVDSPSRCERSSEQFVYYGRGDGWSASASDTIEDDPLRRVGQTQIQEMMEAIDSNGTHPLMKGQNVVTQDGQQVVIVMEDVVATGYDGGYQFNCTIRVPGWKVDVEERLLDDVAIRHHPEADDIDPDAVAASEDRAVEHLADILNAEKGVTTGSMGGVVDAAEDVFDT
jgi:hypothetical protein